MYSVRSNAAKMISTHASVTRKLSRSNTKFDAQYDTKFTPDTTCRCFAFELRSFTTHDTYVDGMNVNGIRMKNPITRFWMPLIVALCRAVNGSGNAATLIVLFDVALVARRTTPLKNSFTACAMLCVAVALNSSTTGASRTTVVGPNVTAES